MKKTIQNYKGQIFTFETYYSHTKAGYGQWNINCEVSFMGEKKVFHHYITESEFIDQISDMKADDAYYEDIQNAYSEKAFDSLKETILDWVEDINKEEE